MFGRIITGCLFALFATFAFAVDPISWKVDQAFPPNIVVSGGNYTAKYTFTNNLPLTLSKPLIIQKNVSPSSEFTFTDQCAQSGGLLAPKQSCSVTIKLDPVSPGEKTLQLIISGYSNNVVKLPIMKTTASGGPNVDIVSSVVTNLPSNMEVNSTAPYRFRFTNNGTGSATGVSVSGSYTDFNTDCGTELTAGSFCEAYGSYTPVSSTPATQTVTATFTFNQGNPVTAQTSTTITTPVSGLQGILIDGLPGITALNTNYSVHIQYKNTGTTVLNVSQNNTTTPTQPPVFFTINSNTCPDGNAPFAAGATCDITGTFNAASDGDYTISSQLIPQSSPPPTATVTTFTHTVSSIVGRNITFINECDFPVWFSLNGSPRLVSGNIVPCTAGGGECPAGSSCSAQVVGEQGACYWENYGPDDNVFKLDSSGPGITNVVTIPDAADPSILWTGTISASTGCNGSSCITASCGNGGGTRACAPGEPFLKPATQIEITLSNTDSYDVSVHNGFHIPIQIEPDTSSIDGYTCGSPGNPTDIPGSNGIGPCVWSSSVTVPQTAPYYWVTLGGASCTTSADCPSTQLCGLDSTINQRCGNFLGYWTASEACARNSQNAQPFFGCNDHPNNSPGTQFPVMTQLRQLYSCQTFTDGGATLLNSCYLDQDSTDRCCGCVNWREPPYSVILPDNTQTCSNSSPAWQTDVLSTIGWIKKTCPSYKTYPFDGPSSTFSCQVGTPNTVDYQVRFCPGGGNSGLPSGKNDGRN